jgi:DNA-binding PadR family transcriptional regulator
MLTSFWEPAAGRRRKYYKLTAAGRKSLEAKRQEWLAFSTGVNGVMGATCGVV